MPPRQQATISTFLNRARAFPLAETFARWLLVVGDKLRRQVAQDDLCSSGTSMLTSTPLAIAGADLQEIRPTVQMPTTRSDVSKPHACIAWEPPLRGNLDAVILDTETPRLALRAML